MNFKCECSHLNSITVIVVVWAWRLILLKFVVVRFDVGYNLGNDGNYLIRLSFVCILNPKEFVDPIVDNDK